MNEQYIPSGHRHLFITVVICVIAFQGESVTLYHSDMTESLEGIRRFIKISTVAKEAGSLMLEGYMTIKYLSIGITNIIVMQYV